MLGNCALVAFATTADPERARAFYQQTLGLRFLTEDPAALIFDANGTTLRLAKAARVDAAAHTILGWMVPDIEGYVGRLAEMGVVFKRYDGTMTGASARFPEAGASPGSRTRTGMCCQ